MMNDDNDIDLMDGEEYIPFFQRTSTLIIAVAVILLSLILLGIVYSIKIGAGRMEKEKALAYVTESKCETTIRIEKYTAKRVYNKYSVPRECAWDVEKDTWDVCDEFKQECVAKDTSGVCIRTRDSDICIRSHKESDYDYNIMDWVDFKKLTYITYDGSLDPDPRLSYFDNPEKYTIKYNRRYTLSVTSYNKRKTFNIGKEKYLSTKRGDTVSIERRKISKNITNLK